MITDDQLTFSDTQAVTATAISEDVYDTGPLATGNSGVDLGTGEPMFAYCKLDVAMTDSGSDSTVTVTIETSAAEGLTSATVLATFTTFAATSAAGTIYYVQLPPGATALQYVGARYTVAGGNLTTGSFTCGLTRDVPVWAAAAIGQDYA
jgi:hypothetical protein